MAESMIERLAISIYHAAFAQYGRPRDKFYPWTGIGEDQKDFCRQQARAAIEAMRKPTEGMMIAGLMALGEKLAIEQKWWRKPEQQRRFVEGEKVMPVMALAMRSGDETNAVYGAMIDKALEDG